MADQHDFSEEYKALWASPFGSDILRTLDELHSSMITDAEKADSLERGYGLLKQASGVMLAVSHLKGKGKQVLSKARRNGEA